MNQTNMMQITTSTAAADETAPACNSLVALAGLPPELQKEIFAWQAALIPLLDRKQKRGLHLELIAKRFGVKPKTARKKFDRFKAAGLAGLVDRRAAGSAFWNTDEKIGISERDRETLKTFCEAFQRNNEAAIREMRDQWKKGKLLSDAPLDVATGYPRGWSERNLARHAPDELELAAARQGRSETDKYRSLVYTTRRNLYVGQYYLFDDLWHDHYCNLLATQQCGRPLEFHGLDLASAYKMCWGMRLRRAREDGTMESLKVEDFRFLLASFLFSTGYNPRGTTLIVEHATTAIDEHTEQLLALASNGAITVERGGMTGAAAHAGQYAGRAKGNFRIKAALESLGNLIHNEFAAIPAQTGKDRQHCPEQLHGLLKHNDALLWAMSQMPVERLEWLQWDVCTLQQFQIFAAEVYARINARTKHGLEGWDERYVPDRQRPGKMRRMSPAEVWTPGSKALRPINAQFAAMIVGTAGGEERAVTSGEIRIRSAEISGDPLRFAAHMLAPRGKYLCVLNPFDTSRLNVFDAKERYVATLDRINVPDRSDVEAIRREVGRAEKALNERLLPMRKRAMSQARTLRDRHVHNAKVVDLETPFTREEKLDRKAEQKRVADMRDFLPDPDLLTDDERSGASDWTANDSPVRIVDEVVHSNGAAVDHDDGGEIASGEDFV